MWRQWQEVCTDLWHLINSQVTADFYRGCKAMKTQKNCKNQAQYCSTCQAAMNVLAEFHGNCQLDVITTK